MRRRLLLIGDIEAGAFFAVGHAAVGVAVSTGEAAPGPGRLVARVVRPEGEVAKVGILQRLVGELVVEPLRALPHSVEVLGRIRVFVDGRRRRLRLLDITGRGVEDVVAGLRLGHPPEAAVGAASAARRTGDAAVEALLGLQHLVGQSRVESGATAEGEVPALRRVVGRLPVVDRLVATRETHGLRVMLLDLLRQQTDLGAVVALVVVAVDRLAVVRLADRLDVLFQPFVGEEAARLRRGRGRTGKRARSFGDIREELRRLERIRLLLQELVVEGGVLRLLRLLLRLASGELRLRALQRRPLRARA